MNKAEKGGENTFNYLILDDQYYLAYLQSD